MTACQKCGGLVLVERELLDGNSLKCVNCGRRQGAETMPRFKTEEGKQRWLASMAARRGTKRATKKTATMTETGSVAMRPTQSGGIAGAIDEIEQKIAALQQMKVRLEEAQALVDR